MTALSSRYDGVLLDLDGTVYRGGSALPAAPEAVLRLRREGVGVTFVTNNAARTPEEVAEHLAELGVDVQPDEIVTSAQAGATLLDERLTSDDRVLVVGTEALLREISSVGLCPVQLAEEDPVAVVQGHSPDTGWRQLAEACLVIRAGHLWVACNIDSTLPTERGEVPGNGAFVAALRAATGCEPVVAGKPGRPLIDLSAAKIGAQHPLMVGDRIETDMAGADAAGLDSLLVLSGVTDPATLLAAPPEWRPTYLAADLEALEADAEVVRVDARTGWTCEVDDGGLTLRGSGDRMDALRALCARWWTEGGGPVRVTGADPTADEVVQALGLDRQS